MPAAQRLTLAAAVLLALAWLVWPAPDRGESVTAEADPAPTVWATWDVEPVEWPGSVDGADWEPVAFLDAATALGTDESGRLLYVEREGPVVTVVADPRTRPGVVAWAATDEALAWIASGPDADGQVVSQLWTAPRGHDGVPGEAEPLSTDTGDVVLAGSAFDLQFADGRLHWLSTARSAQRVSEHRSIDADGGEVEVVDHAGAWQAAAWPWLASAGSDSLGGAELVRADTGSRSRVETGSDELALCSAKWCRLVATEADGARVDLMRPDGTDRVSVAEGVVSAVAADVGLIDRFEPLQEDGGPGRRLTVFDLETSRTYLVAEAAGRTGADDRRLWWSSGEESAGAGSTGAGSDRTWHVLDLTDLA